MGSISEGIGSIGNFFVDAAADVWKQTYNDRDRHKKTLRWFENDPAPSQIFRIIDPNDQRQLDDAFWLGLSSIHFHDNEADLTHSKEATLFLLDHGADPFGPVGNITDASSMEIMMDSSTRFGGQVEGIKLVLDYVRDHPERFPGMAPGTNHPLLLPLERRLHLIDKYLEWGDMRTLGPEQAAEILQEIRTEGNDRKDKYLLMHFATRVLSESGEYEPVIEALKAGGFPERDHLTDLFEDGVNLHRSVKSVATESREHIDLYQRAIMQRGDTMKFLGVLLKEPLSASQPEETLPKRMELRALLEAYMHQETENIAKRNARSGEPLDLSRVRSAPVSMGPDLSPPTL